MTQVSVSEYARLRNLNKATVSRNVRRFGIAAEARDGQLFVELEALDAARQTAINPLMRRAPGPEVQNTVFKTAIAAASQENDSHSSPDLGRGEGDGFTQDVPQAIGGRAAVSIQSGARAAQTQARQATPSGSGASAGPDRPPAAAMSPEPPIGMASRPSSGLVVQQELEKRLKNRRLQRLIELEEGRLVPAALVLEEQQTMARQLRDLLLQGAVDMASPLYAYVARPRTESELRVWLQQAVRDMLQRAAEEIAARRDDDDTPPAEHYDSTAAADDSDEPDDTDTDPEADLPHERSDDGPAPRQQPAGSAP